LPAPDSGYLALETAYIKPSNDVEKSIAIIWQQVLKVEKIGIHDNFFELGGHSLLLLQVHSQLREVLPTDLLVLDLFRYPTISSLAEFITQGNDHQSSSSHQTETRTQPLKKGKSRIKKLLKISKGTK
ncbi:MAG: phosphopantetheine-binding protein, partial [Cyanobacteria bacterium P01_G01_bin.49]